MQASMSLRKSFMLYMSFVKCCVELALAPAWIAANGIFGSLFGGLLMIWRGEISFFHDNHILNWGCSFVLYAAISWVILFMLQMIFVSQYQLWLKGGYKPGKSVAEILAIINVLEKAHAEAVTLVANTLPDSDFHRNRLAAWTMDTLRMMKQLDIPKHEIFCFESPAGLPDQDKCLRERQQLLRSLVEQYMRETQKWRRHNSD
jgi:hypothetical protein